MTIKRKTVYYNCKNELKTKLKKYTKEDIIITNHAKIRAKIRRIPITDVVHNLLNPSKLHYARREPAKKKGEKKYSCYFIFSKGQAHRYVIVINSSMIVVTVIRINRRWQRRVEKYGQVLV